MSGHKPWSKIRHKAWERSRTIFDELREAADASARALNKIGEGDWTPQDQAHAQLLAKVDKLLADPPPLRTGHIIHGDAE